jgi:hypothetical protein
MDRACEADRYLSISIDGELASKGGARNFFDSEPEKFLEESGF